MSKTKAHQRYRLRPTDGRKKGQIVPGSVRVHDDGTWSAVVLGTVRSVTLKGTITA